MIITEEQYFQPLVEGIEGKAFLPIKGLVAVHDIQSEGRPVGKIFYSYEGNWVSDALFEVKVLEGLEPFTGVCHNTLSFTNDSVKDKEWAIENSPHKAAEWDWGMKR